MKPEKLKIMIIEDELCIRESLTWFLEDLGHEVLAGVAPSHCDLYQGHPCTQTVACTDVLLMDHHLPGLKGLDFIETLTQSGCKGIPSNMLLMSGDSTSIDPDKAEALGITVVQKPMAFDYLEKWLNSVTK